MERQVFHSSRTKEGWVVTHNGATVSRHKSQDEAEEAAIAAGRAAHESGDNAQAVLHKADGVIREERTYGDDPRRYPG
jgi:hypothetical protein